MGLFKKSKKKPIKNTTPSPAAAPAPVQARKDESARDSFLWLGDAHLAENLGWGQSEYYALDTQIDKPFYVIEQYDGRVVARSWIDKLRPVSWEEVIQNAEGLSLDGINSTNWRKYLFDIRKTKDSVSIRWRGSSRVNYACRIDCTDGIFTLIEGGDHGPNDRTGFASTKNLTPDLINNQSAFREVLRHKYEDVFETLWNFIQGCRKQLPRCTGKGNGDVTWTKEGGMLTIRGTGKVESLWNATDLDRQTQYDPHNLGPWFDRPGFTELEAPQIRMVILEEGITGISFLALHGMKGLKELHIPASVTDVDLRPDSAFTIHTQNGTPAAAFARENKIPLWLSTF